ncbi:MAG: 3',5'-nucleoside bisphosphate phosphatase [Casimicrobiaceae bacterium]
MLRYDLHCHSNRSDGVLAPAAVVKRAAARSVDVLALTDHDGIAGIDEARQAAHECGIRFVAGAELSVTWEGHTLHVVALGIDPANATLVEGLEGVRTGRIERARRMADALAEAGIAGTYEGALGYVTDAGLIARTHFARHLVDAGHAREVKDVFKRFLTPGKPGYVAHTWAGLTEAIEWIHGAGGQAVLAHPGRYKVTTTGMRGLLEAFRGAGGDAIEILSPSHTRSQVAEFATLARVHGLLGSCGSDFHAPGEGGLDIGDLPPMPVGVTPVWTHW